MVEQDKSADQLREELQAFFESDGAFERVLSVVEQTAKATREDVLEGLANDVIDFLGEHEYAGLIATVKERSLEPYYFIPAANLILNNKDIGFVDFEKTHLTYKTVIENLRELNKAEDGRLLVQGVLFYLASGAAAEYKLIHDHDLDIVEQDPDAPFRLAVANIPDDGVS